MDDWLSELSQKGDGLVTLSAPSIVRSAGH